MSDLIKSTQYLGYKNLIVSGCSFTASEWPDNLNLLGCFDEVFNFSMPGAGNYHIMSSIIYELENHSFSLDESLVIIMLSGFDRDDAIIDRQYYEGETYYFNNSACTGISGGTDPTSEGNFKAADIIKQYKSKESRAIENFIYVNAIYQFLASKGANFIITHHIDRHLPARDHSFVIEDYLDPHLKKKYANLIDNNLQNIYKFCLKNDLLSEDDYHPSAKGNMLWVNDCLIPYIQNKFSKNHES